MKAFKDSKDRTWQLEINCDVIEQVQNACGVNLLDLTDPESTLLKEINIFPPLLGKLLFSALADQAKLKEVDEREFKRSMSGDSLSDATDALLDELVLFCPKHRRQFLQAVLEQNREVEEAGAELALAKISNPELKKLALEALDRKVTADIAAALETLGVTPAAAAADPAASKSSTTAGPPPASSDSPAPALTPGEHSAGSPTEPGSPTAG